MRATRSSDPAPAGDSELLARLLARDETAFLELVNRYHSSLVRLATTMVRSTAIAEEVAQETWQALFEALPSFEQRSSIKTFLFRILTNRARTRGQREARSVPFSDQEEPGEPLLVDRFGTAGNWLAPPAHWGAETPELLMERKDAMEALQKGLEALPELQRSVVVLRDIEGLSAEEACEILEVTEVHQRVLLHRARTRLRLALEGHFQG